MVAFASSCARLASGLLLLLYIAFCVAWNGIGKRIIDKPKSKNDIWKKNKKINVSKVRLGFHKWI